MLFPVPSKEQERVLWLLRWRIKLRYWSPHRDSSVRAVLHWQYTGVFIGLLWATGFAMALAQQWSLAYAMFAGGGLWFAFWWFTSDFLEKRRSVLEQRKVRRDALAFSRAQSDLKRWTLAVFALIVASTLGCVYYVHATRSEFVAKELKQQREDLFDRLTVAPLPFPSFGMVNFIRIPITNESHYKMGEHTVTCVVYGMYNVNHAGIINSYMASQQKFSFDLLGGGRGETVDCIADVAMPAPILCADVGLAVYFTVDGQPNEHLQKEYRYLFGPKGNAMDWTQVSLERKRDYCSS